MTRFEYLKENLTRRELAKYLSCIENCKGECREFCDKYFISAKENIDVKKEIQKLKEKREKLYERIQEIDNQISAYNQDF